MPLLNDTHVLLVYSLSNLAGLSNRWSIYCRCNTVDIHTRAPGVWSASCQSFLVKKSSYIVLLTVLLWYIKRLWILMPIIKYARPWTLRRSVADCASKFGLSAAEHYFDRPRIRLKNAKYLWTTVHQLDLKGAWFGVCLWLSRLR